MAVQVGEGVLADLLEQLLVVDRADEFDAGIAPESRAPLQLVEEPLVDSRDEDEALFVPDAMNSRIIVS